MSESTPQESYRERPEWGPQPGGLYRSPIPPKITAAMADFPRRPSDLPGTVVGSPSNAVPRPHRWLSLRSVPDAPSAAEIAALLNELGASYVLVGGHAVGCWTASARSTGDADFVVFMRDFGRAQAALLERYPALRLQQHDAVARFTTDDGDGSEEAVDFIRSYDALMLSALENAVTVDGGGVPIRIPCPEAQLALKVAAVRSPNREFGDVLQDVTDIARICEGRSFREDLLEALSTPAGGSHPGFLAAVVSAAREGGDIRKACKG